MEDNVKSLTLPIVGVLVVWSAIATAVHSQTSTNLPTGPLPRSSDYDFRLSQWGDTMDQVEKSEPPYIEKRVGTDRITFYPIGQDDVVKEERFEAIQYDFKDGRLYSAKYTYVFYGDDQSVEAEKLYNNMGCLIWGLYGTPSLANARGHVNVQLVKWETAHSDISLWLHRDIGQVVVDFYEL